MIASAQTASTGAKAFQSTRTAPRSSARSLRVCCAQRQGATEQSLKLIAAGLAASALLTATPALAGVVLVQPETKKVFQSEPAAAKPKAEKATPAAKTSESASFSAPSFSAPSLDLGVGVLPLSIAAIAGGYVALSKLDPEFAEVVKKTVIKDANLDGAGYEPALKGEGGVVAVKPAKKGTIFFGKKK